MASSSTSTDPRSARRITAVLALTALGLALLASPASSACHIAAFSPSEYEAGEADGEVTLTVVLLGGQPGCEGTVDYATADGTATAGDDYASSSGELRFDANDDRRETITIALTDDGAAESAETFTVVLSGGTGSISANDEATVSITDDDEAASSPTETPTADETPTTDATPTTDETPAADTGDGGGNGALIAIIVAAVAALLAAAAIGARRRRTVP